MPFTLTALTVLDKQQACDRAEFIDRAETIASQRGHAAVELIDASAAAQAMLRRSRPV